MIPAQLHSWSKKLRLPHALPCLYCGVDSGPALKFFIWMIGGGVLAFICLYTWGAFSNKFSDDVNAAAIPLKLEEDDTENGRRN